MGSNKLIELLELYFLYRYLFSLQIDADNHEEDATLTGLRKERGYSYQDVCEISEATLPNYHEKVMDSVF